MLSFRPRVVALALACLCSPAAAQEFCDGVAEVTHSGLKAVTVASGLSGRPLYVTAPRGDTERIFIVEQDGLIWIKKRGDDPSTLTLFLDITDRVWAGGFDNEAGLLGLAFDPDYENNGLFYVNYFAGSGFFTCNTNCRTVVSRFAVSATDPDEGDPSSEVQLMSFPQPQNNHNGGQVFFGPLVGTSPPRAFLFIATGDGGNANDSGSGHSTCGNGQDLGTLLGKILRIDVAGIDAGGTSPDTTCMSGFSGANYTVPTDNPFTGSAGGDCDEVWAYGLRNPWRNAFDSNGDIYVADVGQVCFEELNYASAAAASGANYGWRKMEGDHCFDPSDNNGPANDCVMPAVSCSGTPACNDAGLIDPVAELVHASATNPCSVTGGEVYRGCRLPDLRGTYFYGDYCAGIVRSFEIDGAGQAINPADWTSALDPGGALANGLTSFGKDAQGEHYIVDRSGTVLKILPLFTDMQVSGAGAGSPFLLDPAGNWSWEDLEFSTMHPVDYYQVYRGVPGGTFTCIHSTLVPQWAAGDTVVPSAGELLAYVVTAVSGGQETSSGDPARTLASPCGPP